MRLFILLFLVSFQAFAANWSDLDVKKTYKLGQDFQLPQTERSGSLLDFSKGEKVVLKEIIPIAISGYSVILFQFDYKACPGRAMTTSMELVKVLGTSAEIAVYLENCELNVYVDPNDFYSKSLFE